MVKKQKRLIGIISIALITSITVLIAVAYFNVEHIIPRNNLENKVSKINVESIAMKNMVIGQEEKFSEEKNDGKEDSKGNKGNGAEVSSKDNIKQDDNNINDSTDDKEEDNDNKDGEYEDLEEDAYSEGTIELDSLMKEMGLNNKGQIIYVKSITGSGTETILNSINGIYSLLLSTQGTTIVQVKYIDNDGQQQTYIKKITYKRPEGSTPKEKQPIINTNIKEQAVYTNNTLNFDIWITNYRGKKLSYNNMEVSVNGSEAQYVGEMGRQTYRTSLKNGANTIKIKVIDSYQYTVTKEYTVFYKSGKGKITISLEAGTVGKKYLISPTTMEIESGTSLSHVIVDFLEDNGYRYNYSGTLEDGFYLAKISKNNLLKGYKIPSSLEKKIKEDGLIYNKDNHESLDSLGEFDFCQGSGWMYSINNTYASYGLDKAYVQNGDTVRIRFTLAYGKDIGGSDDGNVGNNGELNDYGREW